MINILQIQSLVEKYIVYDDIISGAAIWSSRWSLARRAEASTAHPEKTLTVWGFWFTV